MTLSTWQEKTSELNAQPNPTVPVSLAPTSKSCANATSQILYSSSGWGFPIVPFFQQGATAQQHSCAGCQLTGDGAVLAEHMRWDCEDEESPVIQDPHKDQLCWRTRLKEGKKWMLCFPLLFSPTMLCFFLLHPLICLLSNLLLPSAFL